MCLFFFFFFHYWTSGKPASFPFTSNVTLLCGMHSLFKDDVFLTDYFLLMVEFCNRFLGRAADCSRRRECLVAVESKNPQRLAAPLWCGPAATTRIWQLSDMWLAAEPVASCLDLFCGTSSLVTLGNILCQKRIWSCWNSCNIPPFSLTSSPPLALFHNSLRPHVQPWGSHLMALCRL